MIDVFVGYSHQDREIADRVISRLKARGWTVFWDPYLRTGDAWKDEVETKVREACCVVILFSPAASRSPWVRAEAAIGKQRGVLLPVLLGLDHPPDEFSGLQGCHLTGWDGSSEPRGLLDLIHAIAKKCGSSESVRLLPLALFVVVGWPKRWPALGATINMNCKIENHLPAPVLIRFLEANVAGPEAVSYNLTWTVPYDAVGRTEHKRRFEPTQAIDVPPGGLTHGIQLQAPAFSQHARWPPGAYTIDIVGWTTHARREPANLRTMADVTISEDAAGQVVWLQRADDSFWQEQKPTDDAIGVPISIARVRAGVPVLD